MRTKILMDYEDHFSGIFSGGGDGEYCPSFWPDLVAVEMRKTAS